MDIHYRIIGATENYCKEVLEISIAVGKDVTANKAAEEFDLTENKKYKVMAQHGCCVIKIKNDKGIEMTYPLGYFKEFEKALK